MATPEEQEAKLQAAFDRQDTRAQGLTVEEAAALTQRRPEMIKYYIRTGVLDAWIEENRHPPRYLITPSSIANLAHKPRLVGPGRPKKVTA